MTRGVPRAGLLLALALLTGCASSGYLVLQPAEQGPDGSLTLETASGPYVLQTPGQALALSASRPWVFQPGGGQLERDFTAARAALPPPVERYQLYLDESGSHLSERSLANLDYLLRRIQRRAPVAVSVIGHTDRLGPAEVNARMGLLRAQRVADLLRARGVERLGILELQVRSHGERDLLVTTPDATAEPRNRRVEVLLR
ncbi:OmpA family protein [Stutzerimonas azotifigens]|uniref:OmpA family protein n=1 Tax=Stutzerimonas azotifigens TaxID=291995 RepID=UPI0004871EE3|nr:OmpA family protein [Stutzerimonas azotifigens]